MALDRQQCDTPSSSCPSKSRPINISTNATNGYHSRRTPSYAIVRTNVELEPSVPTFSSSLIMYRLAISRHGRLLERLRQRRMCMARPRHILTTSPILHRQHPLGNHLPGIRPHDMDPQDPIRLRITQKLDHPFRLQIRLRPRIRTERETARPVLDPLFFQLRFVLAHPRDFRVGVHDGGDGVVVDVTGALGDVFDCGDGLFLGFMGEHGAEGAVTDDANVWQFSAVLFIDDEAAFVVKVEVEVFEAETGCVGAAADGDEDDVCVELDGGGVVSRGKEGQDVRIWNAGRGDGLQSLACRLWQLRLRA